MTFKDKVALVTGAQQGIGAGCAELLGAQGALVIVNYFDDEAMADVVCEAVVSAGGRAEKIQGDIAKPKDVARMLAVTERHGGVDVLINNAGIFPRVDFLAMSQDDWDSVLNVNLRGTFFCTQGAGKQMKQHGRGGAVVNLTSAAAHSAPALGVHYASSKAGLIGFTRAAAVALAAFDIRVNAVAPGLTDTAQPRYGMTESEIEASVARLPLARIATPKDIAECVLFLASDAARHVTGQTLHVNGGQLFP